MTFYTGRDLLELKPRHSHLVCIDSDGCVFPTMRIKQTECFHPLIIEHWKLGQIARQVREVAEFVNLGSCWRGTNRFVALVKTFELLSQHPCLKSYGGRLPAVESLKRYVLSGRPLSNDGLKEEVKKTGDAELQAVLEWSLAVNRAIERRVSSVEPFEWARRTITKMPASADLIVVSQTPEEALQREWRGQQLDRYVRVIAGQELGTKSEQMQMAAAGRYEADKVLMIGDALGDLESARSVGACFFPIEPGNEEASWQLLDQEAYGLFLAGSYRGAYEEQLVQRFRQLLPSEPPWIDLACR